MPGGRNTRKRSGRGRGAVESDDKRLRSSKGMDEAVEILQFGNGNHGDPDLHTSNSHEEGNAKQPTRPANPDTSNHPRANFVDFEQIIRDSDISLQTSGRSQTSETNPNVLNIPSNTQESFNDQGGGNPSFGGRGHVRTCTSATVSENLGSSVYKYCSPIERKC